MEIPENLKKVIPFLALFVIAIGFFVVKGYLVTSDVAVYPSKEAARDAAEKVIKEEQIFGYVAPISDTGSMLPVLDHGMLVIVEIIDPEELVVGDIAVYIADESAETLIVHEVVEIREDGYVICKGVSNRSVDAPVHPHKILGKVSLEHRFRFSD